VKIGFWNVFRKNLASEVACLCTEYSLDIIIIAESGIRDSDFLMRVNCSSGGTFHRVVSISNKIVMYSRYPVGRVVQIADEGGVAVSKIIPPVGPDILCVAAHLPSKMHLDAVDHSMISVRLREMIDSVELRLGHKRTIVIGDFNMNPFEDGVVAADGLHAIADRRTVSRLSRIVRERQCSYFYNPMWRQFGGVDGAPPFGTYYYQGSTQICYFWNIFDQILLRPAFLEVFKDKDATIVSTIAGTSLLTEDGLPDKGRFSDHLPIIVNINVERMEFTNVN
jgi:hypothetical protein